MHTAVYHSRFLGKNHEVAASLYHYFLLEFLIPIENHFTVSGSSELDSVESI